MAKNLLGNNGFIKLNAQDIVSNLGGFLMLQRADVKKLSAKEGIKYFNGAVQKGFEIATELAPEIRDIRSNKTLKATEKERLVNELLNKKCDTEGQRRVASMVIKGGKNYTVDVLQYTQIHLKVVKNEDGTFTSTAFYKQYYTDAEKGILTTITETPIFVEKTGKGQIRFTNEELDKAINEKQEKLYNQIVELLNQFNELRIESNGMIGMAYNEFEKKANEDIATKSRFATLIMEEQLF